MDPPIKLFKHNNGTSRPVRWFDFEPFNQWSEEIITKCNILHRRHNILRATPSDAANTAPVAPVVPTHITA